MRFGPANESACGAGSAGCYWWTAVGDPTGKGYYVAYIGIDWIDDMAAMRYIVNMEVAGHGCFRMLDMYNPVHQPYTGSMGSWTDAAKSDYWPTQKEIVSAKAWLKGEAPNVPSD